MHALKRMAIIVTATVIGFGILWVGFIYFWQEKMIYYPRGYTAGELGYADEGMVRIEFATSAGRQVAFYRPPRGGGAPERLWMCYGGNGARALDWTGFVESLGGKGAGYLLVDYPGYGLCEGKPSPATVEESVAAAFRQCAAHLGENPVTLAGRTATLGHSLGAAAALMAAEQFELGRVVLISPFTTMKDMAKNVVGGPLSNLVRHRYDNRRPMRSLLERGDIDLTIVHGADDSVIPSRMGRELSEMAPERITFHAVPGADHNDVAVKAFSVIAEAMR